MPQDPTPGSQCDTVLRYIQSRGSITPKDAMEFGCYRLAARVLELRRLGWAIDTEAEEHDGGQHARYFLRVTDAQLEDAGQIAMFA